ncbi:unnamed protein product [Caenorhabditis nigoni]
MLFYKALLAVLASTAVVSALPALGNPNELLNGLTGQLYGVVGKPPLNILKLEDIIQQLLDQLEGIKKSLPISEIETPDVNGIVNGASAMIPEPVSDALNGVKNAASDIGNDVVSMIPHQWLMRL